jgi:hypothetical protein
VAVAVDAVASVVAEECAVAVDWGQAAVQLFVPPAAVDIVAVDSVAAADAPLRCRDLPDFPPR